MTGEKAKFVIDLPRHTLSFNTKLQEEMDASEANLPSEASIDLPKVQVSAEYIQVRLNFRVLESSYMSREMFKSCQVSPIKLLGI